MRERKITPDAQRMVATVAPSLRIGKGILSNPELVRRDGGDDQHDSIWQNFLYGGVKLANGGGPFRNADVLRSSMATLRTVFTDALETVAQPQQMPEKPGIGWGVFGLIPVVPGVYDLLFRTAPAAWRRLHGRDHGKFAPHLLMNLVDFSGSNTASAFAKGLTPGSGRSLDRPIWMFQKTEQIVLADEAYTAVSTQESKGKGRDTYLDLGAQILVTRTDSIQRAYAGMQQLVRAAGVVMDPQRPSSFPELTPEQQAKLAPFDIVRYNLGQRLFGVLEIAQAERAQQTSAPQAYGNGRRG